MNGSTEKCLKERRSEEEGSRGEVTKQSKATTNINVKADRADVLSANLVGAELTASKICRRGKK